jgi:nucleoside 2-deoxyribosyltransferase
MNEGFTEESSGISSTISADVSVYVACPLPYHRYAKGIANTLAAAGFAIASSWHSADFGDEVSDPPDPPTRADILAMNLSDLVRADVVVALTAQGWPRATLAEIGWHLALCKPVVWLQGDAGVGGCIFDASPLVTIVRSESEIIDAVRAAARGVK